VKKDDLKKGNVSWNTGLTSESDDRVKQASTKSGITAHENYKSGKRIAYQTLLSTEEQPNYGHKHSDKTKKILSELTKEQHRQGKIKFTGNTTNTKPNLKVEKFL